MKTILRIIIIVNNNSAINLHYISEKRKIPFALFLPRRLPILSSKFKNFLQNTKTWKMENFISSSTHRFFRQSSFTSLPHPPCFFPSTIFDARLIDESARFTPQTSIPIERNKSNRIFELIQFISFFFSFLLTHDPATH